jgi:hypothetical protein
MPYKIQQLLKLCVLALGLTLALPTQASFIGTNVTFSLIQPPSSVPADPLDPPPLLQDTVIVYTGLEVSAGDGSNIGDFMLSGPTLSEYIDVGADYVEFQLFGAEENTSGGFSLTGFGTGAKYQLDFAAGVLALFETPTAVDMTLTGINNVTFGTELMLVGDSLMLALDTLGVQTSNDGFGTVRLDFQLKDISGVPVPAALPLMLSGLAMMGFLARRRKS